MVKFNFLEFCNNFVPDFENFYYLLNLNSSDSNKESSSKNSESKQKIYAKMHAWRLEMELQKYGILKTKERNANSNQTVLKIVRLFPICLIGTLKMQRFLYC